MTARGFGSGSASRRSVAGERGAERGRRLIWGGSRRSERRLVEQLLGHDRGLHQIVVGDRDTVTELTDEVAAEQRPGFLLVEDVRLPVVRHVRGRYFQDPTLH